MIKVLGIKIIDRIKEAGLTQGILSKHSGVISTRLGFHELTTELCSREAYMILHLAGSEPEADMLQAELEAIGGIEIREMVFDDKKPVEILSSQRGTLRILGILVQKKEKSPVDSVQKLFTSFG